MPPYAAIVCPDLVRVFRLRHRLRWLPPRVEVVGVRWTDLHCLDQAKGCAATGTGLRVSDAWMDGASEAVTVRYAAGRGALLVTQPLRFATLRSRFRQLQRAVGQ
jgi:hypothetical protein